MLIRTLERPAPLPTTRHARRRRAELARLPQARIQVSKPSAADWMAAYPCTRMHGAAFEEEFYPRADEI